METYLLYISKVAVATGAFYLAYLVLFQNRKHFVFNRAYLPLMLALSFVIPLITFTAVQYVEVPEPVIGSFAYLEASGEASVYSNSYSLWPHYLSGIYLLGVAGFLFHLITGHIKALLIIRGSRIKHFFGYRIYITDKDVHPFCFFSRIVISERSLKNRNLRMIIEHEHIHVKEKHTLDILVAEILFILQWFNPFAWLVKDAVKNNLEYKTDNEIIKNHNPATYQLAMVALADKQGVASFLTALNGSQLKNRIIMMKKTPETRFKRFRQLVLLPLVAVLVMGLSGREVKTEYIQKQSSSIASHPETKQGNFVSGKVTNEKGEPLELVAVIIRGKPVGTITDSSGNYKIQLEQADDTLVFTVQGYESQEMSAAGKNKIDVELKPVRTEGTLLLRSGEHTGKAQHDNPSVGLDNTNEPLYVVDGKVTKTITQIPPEDVESIKTIKDESVTERYGPDAKHGVILITTRSKSYAYLDENSQNLRPLPYEEIPLYEKWPEFPGGEVALRKYLADNINYPEIARENGIHGRVHVTFKVTKEGKVTNVRLASGLYPPLDKEAIRVVESMPDWNPGIRNGQPVDVPGMGVPVNFILENPVVRVKSYAQSLVIPGPLYIVDGEETRSIKDIPAEDIRYIDVLKAASATALYGQRGKDGVIVIATKQGTPENKIITELQLRRYIAEHIKYPVEAQRAGLQGTVALVIDPGKPKQVIARENYSWRDVHELEGVIVTGYGGDTAPPAKPETNPVLLIKEVERVLQMLPAVDIPTIDRKLIRINVEFKLQAE